MTTLFAPPTKIQGSFPGATVTVFNAGTVNLATIYADTIGTPKPNPFTADQNDGMWFFYAPAGLYDVQFSGAGIPIPFTVAALGAGGSSAAVVSAGDSPGVDASAKIQAAYQALPATGGTIDACGLFGLQTLSFDPFAAMLKPVTVKFCAMTLISQVNLTVPRNVTLEFSQGAILSMNGGTTCTMRGQIVAPICQIFAGTGHVVGGLDSGVSEVYPQWWGAVPDGVTDCTTAIQMATDFVVGSEVRNFIQTSPAGVVFFPAGTYLISSPISTCHYNGCPGGGQAPAGTINVGIVWRGENPGISCLISNNSIDLLQVFVWVAPTRVEYLHFACTATGVGVRVRGNQTTIDNCWFLVNQGVVIETTATIGTTDTQVTDCLCDSTGLGGPGDCVTVTRTGGSSLSPANVEITNLHCFGGNSCVRTDHIWHSRITAVTGEGQGGAFMILGGATELAVTNVNAVGSPTNEQTFLDGIEITNSARVALSNAVIADFQGPALNIQASTNVTVENFISQDNVQNAGTALPYDVFATNSDVNFIGGMILNSAGHPVHAFELDGAGPAGSYVLDGVLITGTAYNGTVINVSAGVGGLYRVVLANNEFRNVNNAGGATPTIAVGATLALIVTGNVFKHAHIPTNWLSSTYAFTNQCFANNASDGGGILLNGNSFPGFLDGCFNGATPLTQAQMNALTVTGPVVFVNSSSLTVNGTALYTSSVVFNGVVSMGPARLLEAQGADISSANNMNLGLDGNFFSVSGNTQINCIATTGWQNGSVIYLRFGGNPVVKYAQACGAGYAGMLLNASADYNTSVNGSLTLILMAGGFWVELGRKL